MLIITESYCNTTINTSLQTSVTRICYTQKEANAVFEELIRRAYEDGFTMVSDPEYNARGRYCIMQNTDYPEELYNITIYAF